MHPNALEKPETARPREDNRREGARAGRVMSIDVLRGFDLFWIVGGGPVVRQFCLLFAKPLPPWLDRQFEHVDWTGFVCWDIIMPLFLFIVGAAMPFSIGKRIERGDGRGRIYGKVIYRVLVLWVLGMVAQGHLLLFRLDNLQLYSNTLQAIAAGYLITAIAMVELPTRWQAGLAGGLLILYWGLMKFVPVPGVGAGHFTPHENLAMWIDTFALGRFRDGTNYTWILSSLGFGATTLMGALAGRVLRGNKTAGKKLAVLCAAGFGCLLAGWLWSFDTPIIKHIWTSSMVLWSGGLCLLLLALFYWVIDVMGFKRWGFIFLILGMNSIVAYIAPDIIRFNTISRTVFGGVARHVGRSGDFLIATGAFGILWLGLYYMFRKKTFVRI